MRYTHIQLEDRNGITLMEVLIAIGILAVGLSSVAALMPAAGSQAKKAVVADRAGFNGRKLLGRCSDHWH